MWSSVNGWSLWMIYYKSLSINSVTIYNSSMFLSFTGFKRSYILMILSWLKNFSNLISLSNLFVSILSLNNLKTFLIATFSPVSVLIPAQTTPYDPLPSNFVNLYLVGIWNMRSMTSIEWNILSLFFLLTTYFLFKLLSVSIL